MAITVTCPSCGRKLLVPDELLGRSVRCPGCGAVFPGEPGPAVEPSPPPAPAAGSETLAAPGPVFGDGPGTPPPGKSPPPPEGSAAMTPSAPPPEPAAAPGRGLRPCPYCGERIRAESVRCRFCGEDVSEEADRPWERPYHPRVRRDCEPHRGPLLLTLGIISLVLLMCWPVAFVGLPLGIVAWVLGQKDEAKMRAGTMDPAGLGLAQAAKVCGIVGAILNGLYLVGCGVYMGFMMYMASMHP